MLFGGAMSRVRRHVAFVLKSWLVYRAALLIVMYYARGQFPGTFRLLGKTFWHSFTSWDGQHYHEIVVNGYKAPPTSNVAFFPSYPLAIRLLKPFYDDDFVAGVILSNVAFVIALLLLYAWANAYAGVPFAQRAVRYALVMPATHFFSCYYTESFFLLAVAGGFYAYQTRRPLLFVPFGLLAGCTRIPGVFLTGAIVLSEAVRFLREPAERKRILLWSPAWFAPALGLLAYMIFLQHEVGDPLAFSHRMADWGRRFDTPWGSIATEFASKLEAYRQLEAWGAIVLLGLAAYGLWKLPIVYGSFYAVCVWASLSAHMTASVLRYNVGTGVAFFVFASFGKRAERTLLPLLAMFAAFTAASYAAGYFSG